MSQAPSLLLALETSGDICSAAVFRDGAFRVEHAFLHKMHLSERLMENVEAVLQAEGANLESVEAFAVGIGPGSFTGTRIGVMTMKTFAFVQERPLIGIGSLDAMAAEYSGLPGVIVIPVMACRSGEVYACPFQVQNATPIPLAEPTSFPFEDLGKLLLTFESRCYLFCGPAANQYKDELTSSLGVRAERAAFGSTTYPRASVAARLACGRIQTGMTSDDAMNLVPLYISPPPITQSKQPIPTGAG